MNSSHCESLLHRDEAIYSLGCFKIASQEKKPPAVAGRNDHLLENGFNQGSLSLSLFKAGSFFIKVNERNQPSLKLRQVKLRMTMKYSGGNNDNYHGYI